MWDNIIFQIYFSYGILYLFGVYLTAFLTWALCAAGVLEKVDVDGDCPACEQKVKLPVALMCRHVFCYACIMEMYKFNAHNRGFMMCLACKEPSKKLVPLSQDGRRNWWKKLAHRDQKNTIHRINWILDRANTQLLGDTYEPEMYDRDSYKWSAFLGLALPCFLIICSILLYIAVFPEKAELFAKFASGEKLTSEEAKIFIVGISAAMGLLTGTMAFTSKRIPMTFEYDSITSEYY